MYCKGYLNVLVTPNVFIKPSITVDDSESNTFTQFVHILETYESANGVQFIPRPPILSMGLKSINEALNIDENVLYPNYASGFLCSFIFPLA